MFRMLPLVAVRIAPVRFLRSPTSAVEATAVIGVGVRPATPLRRPAGRIVVAGLASSRTVSIEIAVSCWIASRSRPSMAGTECSSISRVHVVITAIFFGVSVWLANPAMRTGIG